MRVRLSFRGDATRRTRNLEIPRCATAHLRSGPSDHPGMTISTAVAQNQLEAEIDLARSAARHHQLCGGAADGIAVNADGAKSRRNQLAHFQVAKANDGDRLLRGWANTL